MSPDAPPVAIRALIVDDEPLARSNLKVLLRGHPEVEILAECSSGIEGLEKIRELEPDLVFLDVQMPECDGFDVLELLGNDVPATIIFVTAYDQYALKAFEAGALDYLLKPFDDARFERALLRAQERIRLGKQSEMAQPEKVRRLVIKSAGRVLFLKVEEVDWIEAADYYACLHVGVKTHLLRRTLTDLERDLGGSRFCRIHRSAIVNLDRVRSLRIAEDGEHEVLLETGSALRLSRRYRKVLQERMGVGEA